MSCEHKECHCHEHKHEHEHEHKHEHKHEHGEACYCHGHVHTPHEHTYADGACCEHCEAKLHGDNTVSRVKLLRLLIGACLLGASFFLPFEGVYLFLFSLVPYLLVGYDVLWDAAKNILRGKVFDEQFLMSVATVGAFAIGELHEGVAVMLFYQLGELLQTLAVGKTRRSIAALMDIRPDTATVLREGREVTLSPDEVRVGEIILVRPGERIPLDGEIVKSPAVSLRVAARKLRFVIPKEEQLLPPRIVE